MRDPDAIVIEPDLGGVVEPNARERAKTERIIAQAMRSGGPVDFLTQRGRLRRSAQRASTAKKLFRARTVLSAGKGFIRSPAGVLAAGLVIGGMVAARAITGEPLEAMGNRINAILLGSLDEKARASLSTRERLAGNPDLLRKVGSEGAIGSDVRRIFDDLYKVELARQVGATSFREMFPVDTTFDMLVKRAESALRGKVKEHDIEGGVARLQKAYGNVYMTQFNNRRGSGR